MKKKKAFSLIEILISLIVISCIMAAFVPVITKKMTKNIEIKAEVSDSGDDEDDGDGYKEPASQADCDPYYALYIPAHWNGLGGKPVCVTRYNAGDPFGPPLSSEATVKEYGEACSAYDNYTCCWQGDYSGDPRYGYCTHTDSYGGVYSGCSRTTCQAVAAETTCAKWAPNGMKAGMWRLPTLDEIDSWGTVSQSDTLDAMYLNRYMGQKGLQWCNSASSDQDQSITEGVIKCANQSLCNKADGSTNTCYFSDFWGQKKITGTKDNYYYYGSVSSYYVTRSNTYAYYSKSVRCVAEKVPKSKAGFTSDKKAMITRTVATSDITPRIEIPITEKTQKIVVKAMISQGGNGGNGALSSSTQKIRPRTQEDCPEYSKRVSVSSSYYGCAAKWNLGDTQESGRSDFALPSSAQWTSSDGETVTTQIIHKLTAGSGDAKECVTAKGAVLSTTNTYINSACCWNSGQTASDYTLNDGWTEGTQSEYSGQNRTVCTWQAAKLLCDNWAPEGTSKGDWALPTKSQLIEYGVGSYSNNKGADGLQYCSSAQTTNFKSYPRTLCKKSSDACTGAYNNACYPARIWTSNVSGSGSSARAYYAEFDNSGGPTAELTYAYYPASVRCVMTYVNKKVEYSGGAGASGLAMETFELPRQHWAWHSGGKIIIDRDFEDTKNGTSHNAAIFIQAKNGNISYLQMLPKGEDGKDAVYSVADDGTVTATYGDAGASATCSNVSNYYYEYGYGRYALDKILSSYLDVGTSNCTVSSKAGYAGNTSYVYPKRGTAADITVNGITYKGGKGGSNESPNGQDGQGYGAGGGGGYANQTIAGVGGRGGIGYIEIEITESQ